MRSVICLFLVAVMIFSCSGPSNEKLLINDQNYFELPGLNVMVFEDIYPEGHQGGVGFIQNGVRVATNGDVRLELTPGQFQPIPKVGPRTVDKENNQITVKLWYPDTAINRKGFNPIFYPDLTFTYQVRVVGEGDYFKIFVDMDKPVPSEWEGKIGFNIELFPYDLFGKTWMMDAKSGFFPPQGNGPVDKDQPVAMATGKKLVVAPESDKQRFSIESATADLELLDGRIRHSNGWFVVRSAVPAGATKNAIEWTVKVNRIPGFKADPVVHTSQVGYHPSQKKNAVIELDAADRNIAAAKLVKFSGDEESIVKSGKPATWGKFLRYNCLMFDFSDVTEEGTYMVRYGDFHSNPFVISKSVYERHVWQPTVEVFLPVQMCHMRVVDAYHVWHDACHLDDAIMAPVDCVLFDGYKQGPSTLTKYKPGDRVPGLNAGGWHDAGDDDLRVESQAITMQLLALAWEEFRPELDATTINQDSRLVRIHVADGKPDILQQIEHGALTVLGGVENLGRAYRGIIVPTLEQYTMVGDPSVQTNNVNYNKSVKYNGKFDNRAGVEDDRQVYTEENPSHEYAAIIGLAASARVLKEYDAALAERCRKAAIGLWKMERKLGPWHLSSKINAACELLLTTNDAEYRDFLISMTDSIAKRISRVGWYVVRTIPVVNDDNYKTKLETALAGFAKEIEALGAETPYGVPYKPHIWGAGWNIQEFGMRQYYLSKHYPDLFKIDYLYNALNFVLGCHPGTNTASFASGVGSKSVLSAYGFYRVYDYYIPGGVVSGTGLIRPDFAELKEFPYLWQQTEYVMGGGETNYLFLVLAANATLNATKTNE